MFEVRSLLALDSPEWETLRHAYGPATDLPALLRRLLTFPVEEGLRTEPWFRLWSCLCHQGDVFPASFAAVPHIVNAAAQDPPRASPSYLQLPVQIDLARIDKNVAVPPSLEDSYYAALERMRGVVAAVAERELGPEMLTVTLAAMSLSQGQPATAKLLLEIDAADVGEVLESYRSR